MKEELQNLRKRGLSISEYLLKIKMLTNYLISAGCPISEEKKLMYMLGGLGEDYNNVLSTIIEKMLGEKITIDDAKGSTSQP